MHEQEKKNKKLEGNQLHENGRKADFKQATKLKTSPPENCNFRGLFERSFVITGERSLKSILQ